MAKRLTIKTVAPPSRGRWEGAWVWGPGDVSRSMRHPARYGEGWEGCGRAGSDGVGTPSDLCYGPCGPSGGTSPVEGEVRKGRGFGALEMARARCGTLPVTGRDGEGCGRAGMERVGTPSYLCYGPFGPSGGTSPVQGEVGTGRWFGILAMLRKGCGWPRG